MLRLPCDAGEVSDGYHTFNELYEHRHWLFLALMRLMNKQAYLARKHADGSEMPGWFVAGILLPTGQITYHLPERLWDSACATGAAMIATAPPWDGHTSADVINRLADHIGEIESAAKAQA